MNLRDRLESLAANLHWTWTPRTARLFASLNPEAWERSNHNPLAVLDATSAAELEAHFARGDGPHDVHDLDDAWRNLLDTLGTTDTFVQRERPALRPGLVAYYCAEFGLHESLPLYSGGLGVLAGDHLKTASDLGVPMVAIGLKYPEGYFRQSIDANGWQREDYPPTDWGRIPARLVARGGEPLLVSIPIADRHVFARVWRLDVGRVPLYLLDTDVDRNSDEDRAIGGRLYSGGNETRIRQEMILGVGGVRLLRALGLDPTCHHLNEGHSAFACLELLREAVQGGMSQDAALAHCRSLVHFTTHTPVAAGHDRFDPDLVRMILWRMREEIGLPWKDFLGLGRVDAEDVRETFCMTVLALRTAGSANGVSALHGEVSRHMWKELWPSRPVDQVPIGHVTNGIHVETFLHPLARSLYEERIGPNWARLLLDASGWAAAVDQLTDDELLTLRRTLKLDLFRAFRERFLRTSETTPEAPDAEWSLGAVANWRADVLTIGFARRFATYKRGAMLFEDVDRAVALLADVDRPVQIIYAGKAHPADIPGKEVIRAVVAAARSHALKGRVLFVENYDMGVARAMVAGVDVWLNTPRRPREASGTSGQKVTLHGGINCSILDGWWAEGYDGTNGWAIGGPTAPADPAQQDLQDREALHRTLRDEVLADYYAGNAPGRNERWLAKVRASLRTLPATYSTRRMMRDYIDAHYLPITERALATRSIAPTG